MARARRPPPRLRAFDLTRYLGSAARGLPPPYSSQQLSVMVAGSAGLYLAILERRAARAKTAATFWAEYNRHRFHRRTN